MSTFNVKMSMSTFSVENANVNFLCHVNLAKKKKSKTVDIDKNSCFFVDIWATLTLTFWPKCQRWHSGLIVGYGNFRTSSNCYKWQKKSYTYYLHLTLSYHARKPFYNQLLSYFFLKIDENGKVADHILF